MTKAGFLQAVLGSASTPVTVYLDGVRVVEGQIVVWEYPFSQRVTAVPSFAIALYFPDRPNIVVTLGPDSETFFSSSHEYEARLEGTTLVVTKMSAEGYLTRAGLI